MEVMSEYMTFIGLYEKKTDQMIPVKMFYRKENEA